MGFGDTVLFSLWLIVWVSILHLFCIWGSCETLGVHLKLSSEQPLPWLSGFTVSVRGLPSLESVQAVTASWLSQREEGQGPGFWENRRGLLSVSQVHKLPRAHEQEVNCTSHLSPWRRHLSILVLGPQGSKNIPATPQVCPWSLSIPRQGGGWQRRTTLPAQESKGHLSSLGVQWQSWVEKGDSGPNPCLSLRGHTAIFCYHRKEAVFSTLPSLIHQQNLSTSCPVLHTKEILRWLGLSCPQETMFKGEIRKVRDVLKAVWWISVFRKPCVQSEHCKGLFDTNKVMFKLGLEAWAGVC